jgi:uncharacterized membrane protein YfhO
LSFIVTHYPGWHATVDGIEVPIYRANDAFKAVVVPPGTHRVRFEFRPVSVYVGLAISATTALLLFATAWWTRARPRRGAPR